MRVPHQLARHSAWNQLSEKASMCLHPGVTAVSPVSGSLFAKSHHAARSVLKDTQLNVAVTLGGIAGLFVSELRGEAPRCFRSLNQESESTPVGSTLSPPEPRLRMGRVVSTAAHPQTDGQTERTTCVSAQVLGGYAGDDRLKWALRVAQYGAGGLSTNRLQPALLPSYIRTPDDFLDHGELFVRIDFASRKARHRENGGKSLAKARQMQMKTAVLLDSAEYLTRALSSRHLANKRGEEETGARAVRTALEVNVSVTWHVIYFSPCTGPGRSGNISCWAGLVCPRTPRPYVCCLPNNSWRYCYGSPVV